MDIEATLASVDEHLGAAREELDALVRIPSISASPEHADAVRASAQASAELLRTHGVEGVRLAEGVGSNPYVLGEWTHAGPDAPTVLLYAHHDVQPPGIVENWRSDPFEPVERDGRLYGRGVADDKAGVVAHAAAVKAWLDTSGSLPCNVKVLIEGEEEIGSPSLQAFLTAHVDELRSDVLVLADAENWAIGEPAITVSLRGLVDATIELRALDGPVHSGLGGGAVPDPVMALARVLTALVDERGDVAIDGIWNDVIPVGPAERTRLDGLESDEQFARIMKMRPGVQIAGDPDVPHLEKLWVRPSLTVIGIDGHPVHGSSNQIVARATARVSMRLAPGQDPDRVLEQFRAHVERHVPWGLELTFTPGAGAPAWHTDPEGPAFDAARRALRTGFGVDAVTMGIGGSIPFAGPFAAALGGVPALLIGPNDPGNGIHGENESLHLADWRSLIRSEVCLLAELSEQLGSRAKR